MSDRMALLRDYFFSRKDVVAFRAPWGAPCPAEANGNFEAMLAGHLDHGAPAAAFSWTNAEGKAIRECGRFRLGTYSPGEDGRTRFACVDCDAGGRHGNPLADPVEAALLIVGKLKAIGIQAYLERSGGGVGCHIWIFFGEALPAAEIRRLLIGILRPLGIKLASGAPADPAANVGIEIFPKQDALEPGGIGNMVWLPWWHGAGDGCCQFFKVAEDGELTIYIPEYFETVTGAQLQIALGQCEQPGRNPFKQRASDASGASVETRAIRYLQKCDPAISGQGGHKALFKAARAVVYLFGLGEDVGFRLLWEHYNPRCQPTWSEKEIRHKCRQANSKPCSRPRGYLRDRERTATGRAHGGNHHSNGEQSPNRESGTGQSQAGGETAAPGFRFRPVDSLTFFAQERCHTWVIQRLLVERELAVIGGPKKCLKTSLLLDLAISLASGTPFLGAFQVYQPVSVAVLSGESGEVTIEQAARRICHARGLDPASLNLSWQFTLPKLSSLADLEELREGLKAEGIRVVLIDPLYLCLMADSGKDAANLFDVGPLLLAVARACLEANCTPILAHHSRKALSMDQPMELDDLSFAGIAEAARQWILLNRRTRFDAETGTSKLYLSVGGSAGQSGEWHVDVCEGVLGGDMSGRKWEVSVMPAGEGIQLEKAAASSQKDQQRDQAAQADEFKVMQAIDAAAGMGEQPPTARKIRELAKLSNDKAGGAITRLLHQRLIEEVSVEFTCGKNSVRTAPGYRRKGPFCVQAT
jgi:hypothetical protein